MVRPMLQNVNISRQNLAVDDISDKNIMSIISHLANLNLYGALNPDKAQAYDSLTASTMICEALMPLLYKDPDLARRLLENMPAHFKSVEQTGVDDRVLVVPDSASFSAILVTDGINLDKEQKPDQKPNIEINMER